MINEKIKESKYFKVGLTAFLVIALSIIFVFLLFKTNEIVNWIGKFLTLFTPFIIGFVFAYLLNPVVKLFKRTLVSKTIKNGNEKLINNLSITITCVMFLAILILLFSIIIPDLLLSIEKLAVNIPTYIEEIKNYLLYRLSSVELKNMIINNYDEINNYLNNVLNNNLIPQVNEWLLILSNGFIGAIKSIFNALIGFVIAIYYLADKDNFIAGIKRILYTIFPIKTANRILEDTRHTDSIFSNFIVGKLLDSFIIGFITFLFLAISGYPYALLIGVIIGITNIIPYFGPWIGAIPSALLILMENPTKCLIFVIFIITLQQIDGMILGPKLCGSKTGLKSFWVLASILFFGKLFGIIGMLIGVPIFALIYGYLDNRIATELKKKELPTRIKDYNKLERINSKSKKAIINK